MVAVWSHHLSNGESGTSRSLGIAGLLDEFQATERRVSVETKVGIMTARVPEKNRT